LDDVFALLHLPIMGQFCLVVTLEFAAIVSVLVNLWKGQMPSQKWGNVKGHMLDSASWERYIKSCAL